MTDYSIKTARQLGTVLRGFRKERRLTQQEVGIRTALPQPIISQIEAGTGRAALPRILKVAAVLELELVVRQKKPADQVPEW